MEKPSLTSLSSAGRKNTTYILFNRGIPFPSFKLTIDNQETAVREIKPKNRLIMGAGGPEEEDNRWPSWLKPLLRESLFVQCKLHADSYKSECNMYYFSPLNTDNNNNNNNNTNSSSSLFYNDFPPLLDFPCMSSSSSSSSIPAPSSKAPISKLPEGCISEILSLTSPRNTCISSAISSGFKSTADSDPPSLSLYKYIHLSPRGCHVDATWTHGCPPQLFR